MPIENGCVLRIYAGEADKHNGRPLYEWIVAQAHAANAHVMFSTDLQGSLFGQHALGVQGPPPLL